MIYYLIFPAGGHSQSVGISAAGERTIAVMMCSQHAQASGMATKLPLHEPTWTKL